MLSELSVPEQDVIGKLLEGEHPALRSLRDQLATLCVVSREMTGTGFMTSFVRPDVPSAADDTTYRIGDVDAEIDGLQHGAGFILYIQGGFLDALEGYSFDEPWPSEIERFTLTFNDPTGRKLPFSDETA